MKEYKLSITILYEEDENITIKQIADMIVAKLNDDRLEVLEIELDEF